MVYHEETQIYWNYDNVCHKETRWTNYRKLKKKRMSEETGFEDISQPVSEGNGGESVLEQQSSQSYVYSPDVYNIPPFPESDIYAIPDPEEEDSLS